MSAERLKDKVAVITGGASGIGLATAEKFMSNGAKVVIGDLNEEVTASANTYLKSQGYDGQFVFRRVDVSNEADVEALMADAKTHFGGLDIAFNNAGIAGAIGPITEVDVDHWDKTFAVMTRGVFLGVKHAARHMKERGGGSIINTSSIAGLASGVIPTAYAAAKAAVVSLTRNCALELAEHRIRVNCVCPGIIFTPLMHQGREEVAKAVADTIQPWPDRGEPEHVANGVLYLASDDSAFVTGEAHVIDGGYLSNGLLNVHPLHGDSEKAKQFAGMIYGTSGQKRELRKLDQ